MKPAYWCVTKTDENTGKPYADRELVSKFFEKFGYYPEEFWDREEEGLGPYYCLGPINEELRDERFIR